jgi:hypothetical protein
MSTLQPQVALKANAPSVTQRPESGEELGVVGGELGDVARMSGRTARLTRCVPRTGGVDHVPVRGEGAGGEVPDAGGGTGDQNG